jgi:plasmid stability protein
MAQIVVRNLDNVVVARLKARAKAKGRSLEAEVRRILKQSVEVAQEKSSKVDMATARQHVSRLSGDLKLQIVLCESFVLFVRFVV